MKTTPKVSILVPCYNSERFIAETLDSCLSQTYRNIEIIVVDDGSTDNSFELARRFESSIVKVYRQNNSGACAARNHAFSRSSGDYVVYLDADDIISPYFIEEHIMRLCDTDGRCVSFGKWDKFRLSIEEATFPLRPFYKDYKKPFQLLIDLWETGGMLQTSCYMVSRQLVNESGGWRENLLLNQDGDFFSRILMIASEAYFVPNAKVYYRKGGYASVSKPDNPRKIVSLLNTYTNYKKNALAHENSIRVREALAIIFTSFIYVYGNRFPELGRQAKAELDDLNVGYMLERIPERVKKISKLIGFDTFMFIRKLLIKR